MERTFETYLREALANGIIDFRIRASLAADGRVVFYIHPDGKDGETADYEVSGKTLEHNRDITVM